MAIVLDWRIRSNNPAVGYVISDEINFSYDLSNDTKHNKTLRYQEREYGINLGWGDKATGDNIRYRKPDGSTMAITYEIPVALRVNNGKWVKYGRR